MIKHLSSISGTQPDIDLEYLWAAFHWYEIPRDVFPFDSHPGNPLADMVGVVYVDLQRVTAKPSRR